MTTRSMLVIVAALAIRVPSASAQLSVLEGKCEVRSNRNVLATLSRHYEKCLEKCANRLGSDALAAQQCTMSGACALGPADPTCRCIERAIMVAVDHQIAGCPDCPECYANGDCTADANAKATTVGSWSESLFFSGSPAVYCDDSASTDGLTIEESRCQQSTAKTLATFSRQTARCYSTCRALEQTGKTPAGSCDAPILTNPNANHAAVECVQKAQESAALRIDTQCGAAGENRPECYGSATGATWATREQTFVDGQDPSYFCGD